MELTRIVHLQGYIQTTYMAIYPEKLLLLDGACRADVPMILHYIDTVLQRPLSQLKVVVVTHMHADHAGGALFLKKATGCQIVSTKKTSQWYGGVAGRTMHKIDLSLAYYVAHRQGKPYKNLWFPPTLTPDIGVGEGDTVPYFEDWQVLETTGHTDRDLSLYHPETQQIYTADLIIKLRHKFVAPVPVYFPKRYRASLKKVQSLNPKQVLMAHGGARYIDSATLDDLMARAPKKPLTVKNTIKHKLFWWTTHHDAVDDSVDELS